MECKEFVKCGLVNDSFEGTAKICYIYSECGRSVERAVAPNLRENIHFSTERGMRIMN
jgi:hypothetical protein